MSGQQYKAGQRASSPVAPQSDEARQIEVTLLTGGGDRPYAFGLATALASEGVCLDVIGSDELDSREIRESPALKFFQFIRDSSPRRAGTLRKGWGVLIYYLRLIRYAATAKPRVFHILWNYKLQLFDRTLLMLYYKMLGKRIVFTAHNVNAGRRDSNDSVLNRLTLRIQYRLADQIFVHTEQMKRELLTDFGVRDRAIIVIPFGVNNSVPDTDLTPEQAKQRLGIADSERTLLFFGNIGPYKGLEFLVAAFQLVATQISGYRLIIAGKARRGSENYLQEIQRTIGRDASRDRVTQRIEHIPDDETELYFKAADVLVLPYRHVYQSGVLFLAYSFGLPVIATDVGSLRDSIVQDRTGLLCKPTDPTDLAQTIRRYFDSDLYRHLGQTRRVIREYASAHNSWDAVSKRTREAYEALLQH